MWYFRCRNLKNQKMNSGKIKKDIEHLNAKKIRFTLKGTPRKEIISINQEINIKKQLLKEYARSEILKERQKEEIERKEKQEILDFLTKDCRENIEQKFFTKEYTNLYRKFHFLLLQSKTIRFGNRYEGKVSIICKKSIFILTYHFNNYSFLSFKITFENKNTFTDFLKSITFIEQEAWEAQDWRHPETSGGKYVPDVSQCITDLFEAFKKIIK